MLAVAVQTDETYWPVTHTPQFVHADALEEVEYVLPATQLVHTAFVDAVQYALV